MIDLTPRQSTRLVHVSSRFSKQLQAVTDAQFGTRGMVASSDVRVVGGQGPVYLSIDHRHLKPLVAMI